MLCFCDYRSVVSNYLGGPHVVAAMHLVVHLFVWPIAFLCNAWRWRWQWWHYADTNLPVSVSAFHAARVEEDGRTRRLLVYLRRCRDWSDRRLLQHGLGRLQVGRIRQHLQCRGRLDDVVQLRVWTGSTRVAAAVLILPRPYHVRQLLRQSSKFTAFPIHTAIKTKRLHQILRWNK